ncbi:MAG: putative membrane protein, partial [Clostridium sp.]
MFMKNFWRSYKTHIKSVLTSSKIYVKNLLVRNKTHMKNVFISLKTYIKNVLKRYKINMKSVFKIYKRDMKNILKSPATLSMILLLTLLPALYAWFNIQAGWDPYLNTKGILVAVVNLDKGSELRSVRVNVGNDVIKTLETNDSIGWTFVSQSEAKEGVKYGKYYASLTIPNEFSKDLVSVATSDNPTKAKLIYTVNEKSNAISPKITGSGASSLQEEITKTFIETASGTIFSFLTQVGVELENNKPQLETVIDMVIDLDDKMPKIKKSLDNVYEESVLLQKYLNNVQGDIPAISDQVDNILDLTKTSSAYVEKSKDSLKNIYPIVKKDLSLINDIANTAESSLNDVQDLQPSNNALIKQTLIATKDQYSDGIRLIDNVSSLNKSMNNFLESDNIDTLINTLSNVRNEMASQQNEVNSMINTLERDNPLLISDINAAIHGANKTSELTNDLTNEFDTKINPKIDNAMENATVLSKNAVKMLEELQGDMPTINRLLGETNTNIDSKVNSLKKIKDDFPKTEQDMHSNSEQLKTLT